MKPIRLEFNAFGPFAGKEIIDFTGLYQAGIFLVSGPTGAGKTTIFDGICFALFGEASGSLRQNENFKSDFADPTEICSVRYLFSVRDKIFTLFRTPKQEKQKKNGEMTTVTAKAELLLPDGSVVTGAAAVTARIQEILGLTAAQFKQITMLAQGDFRRFLDASSGEKQEIFRHIFDTQKFDQFTSCLELKAKKSLENMEKDQQILMFHMQSLTVDDESFQELIAGEFPPVPLVVDQLDQRLKVAQNKILEAQEQIAFTEEKIRVLQLETHRQNNKKLAQLADLELERSAMQKNLPLIAEKKQKLTAIKMAKDMLPLWQKIKELERTNEKWTAQQSADTKLVSETKLRLDELSKRVHQAENDLSTKDSLLSQAAALQAMTPLLEERDTVQNQIAITQKVFSQNEGKKAFLEQAEQYFTQKEYLAQQQRRYEKCVELNQAILLRNENLSRFQKQKAEYLQKYAQFFDGQAGILASKLRDQAPCPVCGSLDHPSPAVLLQNPPSQEDLRGYHDAADHSSREVSAGNERIKTCFSGLKEAFPQVDFGESTAIESQSDFAATLTKKAQEEMEYAKFKVKASAQKIQEERANLPPLPPVTNIQECQSLFASVLLELEKNKSALEFHRHRFAQLESQIPDSISGAQELHERISALQMEAKRLDQQYQSSLEAFQKTQTQLLSVTQHLEICRMQIKDGTDSLKKSNDHFASLLSQHFSRDMDSFLTCIPQIPQAENLEQELQAFSVAIQTVEKQARALKEDLIGVKQVCITDLEAEEQSLKEAISHFQDQLSLQTVGLKNNQLHRDAIAQHYRKIAQEEAFYRSANHLFRIANGNNEQRISFERYVLGFYFDAIVSFANERLADLTGGRYVLWRKKDREKFGRSSGLDLEILDQYSGRVRPTSTLSGGESFKTALALALSLADVVQMHAGGIVIDTMFIDEGFGSLDSDSLDHAVDALLSLRDNGRLVGIISHVAQLKERIPSQIQVEIQRQGSKISVHL